MTFHILMLRQLRLMRSESRHGLMVFRRCLNLPNGNVYRMSVEEAYQTIANLGLHVFEADSWDEIIIKCKIGEQMVAREMFRTVDGVQMPALIEAPFQLSIKASRAALFLRDDLLKNTGERIWGLTMTIAQRGKFNIEYSYDKPPEY